MVKPKELKSLLSKEERRIVLQGGVLYVPVWSTATEPTLFPGWESEQIFGNHNPVIVEYCSGHGHWIVDKARMHPECNWVAVEKKFDRVRRIWAKRTNEGLRNLFIVCAEAHAVTTQFFPTDSVHAVYVNFPDPWPKKRHAKHRLLQTPFLRELWRITRADASLVLASDDQETVHRFLMATEMAGFSPLDPAPYFVTEWPDYGSSWFNDLWRDKGRTIHYVRCQRIDRCLAASKADCYPQVELLGMAKQRETDIYDEGISRTVWPRRKRSPIKAAAPQKTNCGNSQAFKAG